MLSEWECEGIRDQVLALQSHWTTRAQGGYFTLGAAAYLDAREPHSIYLEEAKKANSVLHPTFASVHERVRRFFEQLFGEAVYYDHHYALPGFHIFLFDGREAAIEDVAARAHFDLQWKNAVPGCVPKGTLSFTLLVEEPLGGASMEIWHLRYRAALRAGISASEYASSRVSQRLWYHRGGMVVHDGLVLHAIGRGAALEPKGFRITLQGHGLRMPQGWMLYW
jgi:hypothetical protein